MKYTFSLSLPSSSYRSWQQRKKVSKGLSVECCFAECQVMQPRWGKILSFPFFFSSRVLTASKPFSLAWTPWLGGETVTLNSAGGAFSKEFRHCCCCFRACLKPRTVTWRTSVWALRFGWGQKPPLLPFSPLDKNDKMPPIFQTVFIYF